MPYLVYSANTPHERLYELKLGVNTIGRHPDNTVVLVDGSISRHHAEIVIAEDSAKIKDLGSRNHTLVNGVEIDESQIHSGDLIQCGLVEFEFVRGVPIPKQEAIALEEYQPMIVKRFAPKEKARELQDILEEKPKQNSILKLRFGDTGQRIVDKLEILLEVSKQLCSPEDPDKLLAKILELLFKIMEIDRAVILLVNEESQDLEEKALKMGEGIVEEDRFYSTKIVNLVRETGEAILTADARLDRRLEEAESILAQNIRASMCVPLKPHNKLIGVLYVDNLSLSAIYSDEDLEFLTALANQAAAIVDMAREFYKREQQLQQQVVQLQIEIDQAKKERELADIVEQDYFKDLQKKAEQFRKL